jgi:hypothetical protein
MSSGVIDTMSMPAFSAASASSIVVTRSMVSCRLPLMALRSAMVGLFRLMDILFARGGPAYSAAAGIVMLWNSSR